MSTHEGYDAELKQTVFLRNEHGKLSNSCGHGIRKSFMDSPGTSARKSNSSSRNAHFLDSRRRLSIDGSNFNHSTPFLSASIRSSNENRETSFDESPFKSTKETLSLDDSPFFEHKLGFVTDEGTQTETKEMFFQEEDVHDSDFTENARGNSLDEVILKIYNEDDDNEKYKARGSEKKRKLIICVFFALYVLLVGSMLLAIAPVLSCNSLNYVCYPQLTVRLTEKSPIAKTALLTVREALKVLSYLAIDFGDSESYFINESLETYYQNQGIDTFNVNTTYQLNFLGYCRSSTKNLERFCMRSYGFDILSVFVRDAGVQLGELTKTNLNIMGDSFAIAYELAVNSISQLNLAASKKNEYTDYAVLLQKFSKGLGFLSYSQPIMICVLTVLVAGLCMLNLVANRFQLISPSCNVIHGSQKVIVILQTFLGFLNLLISFLIVSLTSEYLTRLKDVAEQVGVADVATGVGFVLIWLSFGLSILVLVFFVYLANSFRKGLL